MTGFTDGMRSSLTDEWATPRDLFDRLNQEFHFTLDVCADESNHKCARYFDKAQNGLNQDWGTDVCWMNPPYGRTIGKWMDKAVKSMRGGGYRGLLNPRKDRYEVVEGVGNESIRDPSNRGACEVRRVQDRRTVSVSRRNLRNPDNTPHKHDAEGGPDDRMHHDRGVPLRTNHPHDTEPIHSIDHIPRTCWTCVHWAGGDIANHLCDRWPGGPMVGLDPCKKYELWEEWLYVEWFYPSKKRVKFG